MSLQRITTCAQLKFRVVSRMLALLLLSLLTGVAFAGAVTIAAGPPAQPPGLPCPPPYPSQSAGNPSYTNSTSLSGFTSSVKEYSTLYGDFFGNTPYQPTTTILTGSPTPPRITGFGSPCSAVVPFHGIIAGFTHSVSQILVFPSLDHVFWIGHESNGFDAYQYSIWGLTVDTNNNVVNQKLLFDPISVFEADNNGSTDPHFTLSAWYGTAPKSINNWLTPGPGNGSGVLGYETYFDFGTGNQYQLYGFAVSTLASANVIEGQELELSAVAEASVPAPATLALLTVGLAGLAFARRKPQ